MASTSRTLQASFRRISQQARCISCSARLRSEAPLSPKLDGIVQNISSLTLLEAADLVQALKTKFNISDVMMAPPAAAASAAPAAAAAPAEEEKPKEKTNFTVNLTKIDATQKAKAIKEVKSVMPTMNLVEAKKFVESLPQVLKENATKEEADKLKAALEKVGAAVTIE